MSTVLETVGLLKRFGGITATDNVTLKVEEGERLALIGPNGAGKTTLVNLLTGILRPSDGRILLEGKDITSRDPNERVHLGMARTFQINQLFGDLTPLETIALAVSERLGHGANWWGRLNADATVTEQTIELIEQFHLTDVMNERTIRLPYGKQRLLEIALAIACRPRVLLLDEPAAGVPESERQDILSVVASLPKHVTVLLIEHDMDVVFTFADRIAVLVNGALFADGTPNEIANDPRVKLVYLGEAVDA
jgi:branched-chain amino acid transport system ATP-binding protein